MKVSHRDIVKKWFKVQYYDGAIWMRPVAYNPLEKTYLMNDSWYNFLELSKMESATIPPEEGNE